MLTYFSAFLFLPLSFQIPNRYAFAVKKPSAPMPMSLSGLITQPTHTFDDGHRLVMRRLRTSGVLALSSACSFSCLNYSIALGMIIDLIQQFKVPFIVLIISLYGTLLRI